MGTLFVFPEVAGGIYTQPHTSTFSAVSVYTEDGDRGTAVLYFFAIRILSAQSRSVRFCRERVGGVQGGWMCKNKKKQIRQHNDKIIIAENRCGHLPGDG